MSGKKCKHCGSSDIEVDPARGDAVCTNCGSVLEDNIIVAEIEFQENAHGGASTIGQFVSAESKGGATGFGRAFNVGIGQESREVTLRKAREGITALCQQLRLNQQCIDIACNFYKMALSRHLTIGRPSSHTQAACVYMTCRTEGTAHLLIDVSDAVPICCYQVGRTYFKLSRALCINIPPTDPCLYILRFSSQLQFAEKSHEVSMTALRLVQRMKRDSIHSGRRPSGICGAALLIAARLHEFNRTPADVVRIVKVHESTLRKRLLEFGDTPSSALTLEEFMTVDLEEEQDPPAFRAARKRDKERLQKLMEEEDGEKELTDLQKEIEHQLENDSNRRRKVAAVIGASTTVLGIDENSQEDAEASRFAAEDALDRIGEIAKDVQYKEPIDGPSYSEKPRHEKGLGPDLAVIGLGGPSSEDKSDKFVRPEPKQKDLHNAHELVLDQKAEEYINSLIMSEEEVKHKAMLWHKINAGYLKEQKIKEELRAKEREENKDKKKKLRGSYKKRTPCNAATAGEAIEKMIAEKKISSKINYDILKSLDNPGGTVPPATPKQTVVVESKQATPSPAVPASPVPRKRKKKTPAAASPAPAPRTPATPAPPTPQPAADIADDYEDEIEPDPVDAGDELSLAAMLQNGQDDDYYDYEEY
ncbi:transcription factor IIIB 90 kDa subunit isoform X1 [Helicoverpa zea]|uniref:transcription factor IIIB 90 kDa subunit isoform X1 n=1 Tax=Helicoverpa zea TaxID=7113 RepID=UPI001F56196A|nr:transcription factor IIIB 90 kDa subunit isoform X1 [Helicoverpa zea]XP_047033533.1 transcription factor IIIB 90 kDa subunit isoform X1 [Helicoverpa zea]